MSSEGGAVIHGVPVSWDGVRDLFTLDPKVTYLNHGAFGAVPVPVQRAQQRLRDELELNPAAFITRGLMDRLGHVRRHIAGFLGADAEALALVPNATAGAAVVLGSLRLKPGDEILTTDQGYGAVSLAVQRECARTGAVARTVSIPLAASDEEVLARVIEAARPDRTRLAIVDQITSPTARLLPVARIAAGLRAIGVPLLVDAAHVPGMLPVDVSAIGADFWIGNLHKWAFGARPTSVLAVAPQHRAHIEPLVVSWEQPNGFPAAVEFGGTLDYTAWLAAPTGLHLLRTLGLDQVREHNVHLADYGQLAVAAAVRADPARLPRSPGVSMRLVPLPESVCASKEDASAIRDRLSADYKVEVATSFVQGQGFLRLCAQVYNAEADMDRLADAVGGLIGALRPRAA